MSTTVPMPAAVPPRGRGELILVVDDEPAIRQVTRATLVDHGYRVLTAGVHSVFDGQTVKILEN